MTAAGAPDVRGAAMTDAVTPDVLGAALTAAALGAAMTAVATDVMGAAMTAANADGGCTSPRSAAALAGSSTEAAVVGTETAVGATTAVGAATAAGAATAVRTATAVGATAAAVGATAAGEEAAAVVGATVAGGEDAAALPRASAAVPWPGDAIRGDEAVEGPVWMAVDEAGGVGTAAGWALGTTCSVPAEPAVGPTLAGALAPLSPITSGG